MCVWVSVCLCSILTIISGLYFWNLCFLTTEMKTEIARVSVSSSSFSLPQCHNESHLENEKVKELICHKDSRSPWLQSPGNNQSIYSVLSFPREVKDADIPSPPTQINTRTQTHMHTRVVYTHIHSHTHMDTHMHTNIYLVTASLSTGTSLWLANWKSSCGNTQSHKPSRLLVGDGKIVSVYHTPQ